MSLDVAVISISRTSYGLMSVGGSDKSSILDLMGKRVDVDGTQIS